MLWENFLKNAVLSENPHSEKISSMDLSVFKRSSDDGKLFSLIMEYITNNSFKKITKALKLRGSLLRSHQERHLLNPLYYSKGYFLLLLFTKRISGQSLSAPEPAK